MIKIDYRDARPIYEQVVDGIEGLALRGALPADTQRPSVRQLAMELSLSVLLSIVYYNFFFLSRRLLYFRDYSIIGAECVSFFLFTPTKLCGISVTIHKNTVHNPPGISQISMNFPPICTHFQRRIFSFELLFFYLWL